MADQIRHDRGRVGIIGAACRFPGASTLDEYWNLIRTGTVSIRTRPLSRPGKRASKGGFLTNIEGFDAEFFKISPEEAAHLDPQQRLILETAWQSLESAGLPAKSLRGTSVGVFVGISGSDYGKLMIQSGATLGPFTGTGILPGMAAGRLSYLFDFHGPSTTVDTACSSSLAAVHLACNSLLAGECDTAIAGGVNVILDSLADDFLEIIGAVSRSGACRAFDEKADGYVRGEGCGMVVLRREADAMRANSCVLAVILGSAMNHDGKSNGLTSPNGQAQTAVIRAAMARAGISASDVDYVETHGTGTRLGDPVELRALAKALNSSERERRLLVGSVKANIGHLEAAAGVAGLIKAVLSIRHGEVPTQPEFTEPNTLVPWGELSLEVPTETRPWRKGSLARTASVSAFGFTGTNVHLILQSCERVLGTTLPQVGQSVPIIISGRTANSVERFADELMAALERCDRTEMVEVASTLSAGRSHLDWRIAFQVSSRDEMLSQLRAISVRKRTADIWKRDTAAGTSVEFSFGAFLPRDWRRLARHLCQSNCVFKLAFEACTNRDSTLAAYGAAHSDTEEVLEVTCSVFAFQYAAAQMLLSWGLKPDKFCGFGVGAFVAAAMCERTLENVLGGLKERAVALARQMESLGRDASEERLCAAFVTESGFPIDSVGVSDCAVIEFGMRVRYDNARNSRFLSIFSETCDPDDLGKLACELFRRGYELDWTKVLERTEVTLIPVPQLLHRSFWFASRDDRSSTMSVEADALPGAHEGPITSASDYLKIIVSAVMLKLGAEPQAILRFRLSDNIRSKQQYCRLTVELCDVETGTVRVNVVDPGPISAPKRTLLARAEVRMGPASQVTH